MKYFAWERQKTILEVKRRLVSMHSSWYTFVAQCVMPASYAFAARNLHPHFSCFFDTDLCDKENQVSNTTIMNCLNNIVIVNYSE
jgi:hypothetical protein